MNAALGDARKSDVDAVFATIAEKAGVLDGAFTKEAFLADLHDWESAVKPASATASTGRRSTSSTGSSSPTRSPRGARPTGRTS